MDRQAVELDVAVLHAVEPCLEPGGLVSLPVGEQLGQPRVRDAVIPIVAERRAELSVIKPSPQTLERQRVKGDFCSDLHGQNGQATRRQQARTDPCASTRLRADARADLLRDALLASCEARGLIDSRSSRRSVRNTRFSSAACTSHRMRGRRIADPLSRRERCLGQDRPRPEIRQEQGSEASPTRHGGGGGSQRQACVVAGTLAARSARLLSASHHLPWRDRNCDAGIAWGPPTEGAARSDRPQRSEVPGGGRAATGLPRSPDRSPIAILDGRRCRPVP